MVKSSRMDSLLASESPQNSSYRGFQVLLQDHGIKDATSHCLFDYTSICVKEMLIPIWKGASGYHLDRLSAVEFLLPVGQIQKKAKIVPGKHTIHAGAYSHRVNTFDMLIRRLMHLQHILPPLTEQGWLRRAVHILERDWEWEALRQYPNNVS